MALQSLIDFRDLFRLVPLSAKIQTTLITANEIRGDGRKRQKRRETLEEIGIWTIGLPL